MLDRENNFVQSFNYEKEGCRIIGIHYWTKTDKDTKWHARVVGRKTERMRNDRKEYSFWTSVQLDFDSPTATVFDPEYHKPAVINVFLEKLSDGTMQLEFQTEKEIKENFKRRHCTG